MILNKMTNNKIKKIVISIIFAFVNLFGIMTPVAPVYAEPENTDSTVTTTEVTEQTSTEASTNQASSSTENAEAAEEDDPLINREDLCKKGLEGLAWLGCDKTEKGAGAVDWLYGKIETVLEINPIAGESGNIVLKIWEIARGITNIIFVIIMMVVIMSQITGLGISNYGIKRALPKLIVAAVAVNLSFYICNYAIDISNTFGLSIRNLFSGIESGITGSDTMRLSELSSSYTSYYNALAGSVPILTSAGFLMFESGTIFMLIPAVLAALIAVFSGFLTIALRQVIVVLCVMVAPLAIVAYILPNTSNLFKKWRSLFTSMLVFYPMFSLLFGASSLAGFAVVQAAGQDSFMRLIGMLISLAPLLLCWKMMKMSGTVLSGVYNLVNGTMQSFLVTPVRGWAASHRAERYARTLAMQPYTPSAKLMQFLENRRIGREADTAEYAALAKNRALALNTEKHYRRTRKGKLVISASGEEAYEMQARNMDYSRRILRDQNNMNKGLGQLEADANERQKARLNELDNMNVRAADALFAEQVRGSSIEYHNSQSREKRFDAAMNAHADARNGHRFGYVSHPNSSMSRYNEILDIMDGDVVEAHYAAASASSVAASQRMVRQGQFQKYFDNIVPTQDVVYRLKELTTRADSSDHMNEILAGLRTLNQRGDTDLLINAINDLTKGHKLNLGTSASQALSNFLMTEVKDSQPLLRRFGKYMNLETARYFNTDVDPSKRRQRQDVDMDEYINGGYEYTDANGTKRYDQAKRGAVQLLMGTSFKGVERLTFDDITNAVKHAAGGNKEKENKLGKAIMEAIMPNVVSDQFNYASGSEQITSFATFTTGLKAVYDDPNDPKSVRYVKSSNFDLDFNFDRTKSFLGAHVANQIARSKSDMMGPMMQLMKEKAAKDFWDFEHGNRVSKEYQDWLNERRSIESTCGPLEEGVTEQDLYAHWLFRSCLPKSVRGGLAKTIMKGFQGDTKDNLMAAMGYKDFRNNAMINYEVDRYAVNSKQLKNNSDNEDDDMPGYYGTGVDYSAVDIAGAFDDIFDFGRDPRDVNGVLNDIQATFYNNPRLTPDQKLAIRSLVEGGALYHRVAEIQTDLARILHLS